MSTKKKSPSKKREWQPLVKDTPSVRKLQEEKLLAQTQKAFPNMSEDDIRSAIHKDEVWGNDRYTVTVTFKTNNGRDGYIEIGVHNHKRTTIMQWSHLQQIKNEIAGPDREAVMIFPSEDRLVDTANEYWLYVYPTGEFPRWNGVTDQDGNPIEEPLGMNDGRVVQHENENPIGGAKQTKGLEK